MAGNLTEISTLRTMVIYDSFFGNTKQIAKAIGEAFEPSEEVEVVKVSEVNPRELIGLKYLIVGSPTRAFRPTGAINDLIKKTSNLKGVKVTAFDTRIAKEDTNSRVLGFMVNIFGYAAKPISNGLVKKGGILVVTPEGFYVEDTEGPLKDGELERAAEWARKIIAVN